MRIPALTFILLSGVATLVSAAPVREENTGRVSYSDRRGARVKLARQSGWIELASATPASHGREFIVIGADASELTQLRLTAASGRPGIRAVRVDYKDGGHRSFPIEKTLGAYRRSTVVDLRGVRGARAVAQIIVYTDRDSGGSYTLEGNLGDSVVATQSSS